ncbi:PAS domain S-box protein [Phaeobacter sp. PT47_59]|uniref:PAS domain S-box protein n=1 Tax=Phaeobacter sp. PT47_59 TaxID=3029979 RepID=UPI0023806130|nr:PAS domain S-box protein [Phaeobacter sp. PT47_59]MDE4173028.1 PAS domain S-box protein [Phaeobacter sp. PT47_59]
MPDSATELQNRPEEAANIRLGRVSIPGLFRDLPEAVIVADEEREIVWANNAALAMFGYTIDQLIGQSTEILYPNKDAFQEAGTAHFNKTGSATDHNYEANYLRANGKVFLGETTGGPMRGANGEVLGYFGITRDISKTRAFEELLANLYRVSSDQSLDTAQKIDEILKMGCAHFQTDSALVSWVRGETYTVLYSHSEIAEIERGSVFKIADCCCARALETNGPVACNSSQDNACGPHPCYSLFVLETYIGVPLIVDGTLFGTVNFTSSETRAPFESSDLELIKMFAAWISQQLSIEKEINGLPDLS